MLEQGTRKVEMVDLVQLPSILSKVNQSKSFCSCFFPTKAGMFLIASGFQESFHFSFFWDVVPEVLLGRPLCSR